MSPFVRGAVRGGALAHVVAGPALLVVAGEAGSKPLVVLSLAMIIVGGGIALATDTPWWRGEEA